MMFNFEIWAEIDYFDGGLNFDYWYVTASSPKEAEELYWDSFASDYFDGGTTVHILAITQRTQE